MELILNIVEAAIVQNRAENVSWCLKLSLICSTIRASVLPLAYEVLLLDIPTKLEGEFAGWDGRVHKNSRIAFLTWLLHDPTAPPRRHIKQLIFRADFSFVDKDLDWVGPRISPVLLEWPIEQLTCLFRDDAIRFYRAGLRPQKTFQLQLNSFETRIPLIDIFTDFFAVRLGHSQIWTEEPEFSEDGSFIAKIEQQYATRREIDLITGQWVMESTPPVTKSLTIQLYDGDYMHHFPNQLLADLANVLIRHPDIEVVLACSVGYSIGGKTIEEFIQGASQILPAEAVQARLRISHAASATRNTAENVLYALAQAEIRGDNPWDRGRAICQFPQ